MPPRSRFEAGDGDARRPAAGDEGDFVTVARRFDPIAAELLRGRLSADGIPARLADAHLVQAYSLSAAALGGVRVMVPASWAPQALRVIAALEQGALALEDGGASLPEAEDNPPTVTLAFGAVATLLVVALFAALVL